MAVNIEELSFQIDDLRVSYTSFTNFTRLLVTELKNSFSHDIQLLTKHLLSQFNNKNL